jgi:TonB family protein
MAREPIVLNWTAPEYPAIAIRARVTGSIKVELPLDAAGRPTDAACLRTFPLLCGAATKAARQWAFDLADGAEHKAVIEFVFQLMPVGGPPSDARSRFLSPSVFAVRAGMPEVFVQSTSSESCLLPLGSPPGLGSGDSAGWSRAATRVGYEAYD